MSAQFFSSLADNALFVAAIELLQDLAARRRGSAPALVPMFALFYVMLAPLVGAFADAVPKGKVMFVSNTIKVVGCLLMLFGAHPLLAYAIVGPRRGGLFAGQVRHPDRAAAALAAGQGQRLDRGPDDRLDHPRRAARRPAGRATASPPMLLAIDLPIFDTGIDTRARGGDRRADRPALRRRRAVQPAHPAHRRAAAADRRTTSLALVRDFCELQRAAVARQAGPDLAGHHHAVLGRVAATCATSCWPGPRRRWATAPRRPRRWSAWWRSARPSARWSPRCAMRLDQATSVIPLGIAMGVLVIGMNFIGNVVGGRAVPDRCWARSAASWWCR